MIFKDRIEIINPGCLYGGLKVDDIKLGVSRQRNPLMAELAAKTMIYRGLGGVKYNISKLQEKGLMKRVGGRKLGEWKVLI